MIGPNTVIQINGNVLQGASDYTLSIDNEVIDITTFGDGLWRKKISTLKDFQLSVSGEFKTATADVALRTAGLSTGDSNRVTLALLYDGTNGFTTVANGAMVSDYEISADVGGTVKFSATLSGSNENTGLAAVP